MWIQDSKGTLFNLQAAERLYIEDQSLFAIYAGKPELLHRFDSEQAAKTTLEAIASQLQIIHPLNLD